MEPEIRRRKFGKTGIYVSELSYGAMNLRLLESFDEAEIILNYMKCCYRVIITNHA